MSTHGFTSLLAAVVVAFPASTRAQEFSWKEENGAVSLVSGQQTIWRFNYGADQPKPCFHPLALPGGEPLTDFRPADHPWHRALWFSWKFINGVNYWEEDKTGKSAGVTETLETIVEQLPEHQARITQSLAYHPAGAPPVLDEKRTITVSPPDKTGAWHMDWDMTFTALTEVKLDRTPLPGEPGGAAHGGYAGLSVRLAAGLTDIKGLTTTESATFREDRYRAKSPAFDYTGLLGGRECGIAILDHPQNPNAPSPWYAINGAVLRYFSPAVICYQPMHLKKDATLRLRYRIFMHPGRWDAPRLVAAAAAFSSVPPSKSNP